MKSADQRKVVAIFDFDGTLTRTDTFRDILSWQFGPSRLMAGLLVTSPLIASYVFGFKANDVPKRALFKMLFKGWKTERFRQVCTEYATQRLPFLLRPSAMERVKWHHERGHRLMIVSASLTEWISPWALKSGFSGVVAAGAESWEGVLSGNFDGLCAYGSQKVNALNRLGVNSDEYFIYAYGDSRGDRELLDWADEAHYRAFND